MCAGGAGLLIAAMARYITPVSENMALLLFGLPSAIAMAVFIGPKIGRIFRFESQ